MSELIEDNPGDVRLTQEVFKGSKLTNHMYVVNNGEEAMTYLHREGKHAGAGQPDLILLDVMMPGMDGFQFAEAVRGDARWKDVPLVALSGHANEAAMERGRAAGFDDYVTKHDRAALVSGLAQTVAMVSKLEG